MPPLVNNQPPFQSSSHMRRIAITIAIPICNRPNQRLAHHLRQKNRQGIVIPKPRNLNGHLHPRAMPRDNSRALTSFTVLVMPGIERFIRQNRFLNFGLDANDGLCSVRESDACAPVCAGEDVGFCAQGPELGWRAPVWSDGSLRERERGVEVGKLCGGEVGGLGGRRGLSLVGHFLDFRGR